MRPRRARSFQVRSAPCGEPLSCVGLLYSCGCTPSALALALTLALGMAIARLGASRCAMCAGHPSVVHVRSALTPTLTYITRYAPSEAVDSLVRRTVGLWRRQLAQGAQRKVQG